MDVATSQGVGALATAVGSRPLDLLINNAGILVWGDDNTSGGAYGYRMSKAALNMAGKSLAEDLKATNVAVLVQTNLRH